MKAPTSGGIDGVLQQDDAIDSLTDRQIMDVWVREKLMKTIVQARGSRWLADERCDRDEYELSEMHAGIFRTILFRHRGYLNRADDLDGADTFKNVQVLWDVFTGGSEISEERKIAAIRHHLKESLRCVGMPDTNVARARVHYHVDFPEDLGE